MRIAVEFTEKPPFQVSLIKQKQPFVMTLTERLRVFAPILLTESGQTFTSKLTDRMRSFSPRFGEQYGTASEVPIYDGIYRVTPDAEAEQTLATAQKQLLDDIVVEKIPFFEVSNNSGGNTVYIGSEV